MCIRDRNYPEPANTGRAYKIKDAPGRYIVYLKNSFPAHLSLEGLRVVIDCANGANYRVCLLYTSYDASRLILPAYPVKLILEPDHGFPVFLLA